MTYSPLIFVCIDIGSRPLNQHFLITYSSLIFVQIVLVLVINQQFLIVHVSLIFVCVGCLDTSTNVLLRNIHSLSLHDFCLLKTVPNHHPPPPPLPPPPPPLDISILFQSILFLKEFLEYNGYFGLFTKIKKEPGTSFWCTFSAWLSHNMFLTFYSIN